jgi:hypothetical protein
MSGRKSPGGGGRECTEGEGKGGREVGSLRARRVGGGSVQRGGRGGRDLMSMGMEKWG